MKNLKILLFLLPLVFIQACETEVELFGDGEQVAVVFALLDQSQPVQYFRINPTFKGEGSASELAGDPTLTNFDTSQIEVRLYDLDSSSGDSEVFYRPVETTDIKLDDDGIFDPNILMFKLETPVTVNSKGEYNNQILRPDHTYRLWVRDNYSGATYTSSEVLMGNINDLKMLNPADRDRKLISTYLKFYTGEQYSRFTFQIGRIDGARRYKLEMNYYYTEGGDTVPDSLMNVINYVIGETNDVDPNASSISFDFDGEKFYQILGQVLDASDDRTGRRIDLIVTAAGNDLDTYIEVQNASISGLSQERPSYTNIDNGLGVFSFRSTRVYPGFFLNSPSGKWVVDSDYTFENFKCSYYGSISDSQGIPYCR